MPRVSYRAMLRLLPALLLPLQPVAAQDRVRLPDLGSSANALISAQEAQDYGDAMLRQMRVLNLTLDDPLLDDYINGLGHRLAAASEKPKDHFQFFIVRDSQINAFAAPGGYIGVNSGLIVLTQSESELAGVIAHEIGHITQNHLQRSFEDAKKSTPLLALILLGALAISAGGGGAQGGMAALLGGQNLLLQRQINFTRSDETEADRTGIRTLANAGFDPDAMAQFFQRMADATRVDGDRDSVPELLQSHPVTSRRISDAKARATQLICQQKLKPSAEPLDEKRWSEITTPMAFVANPQVLYAANRASRQDAGTRYVYMRERARVLASNPLKLVRYYAGNLAKYREFDTPANHYGYALALTASGHGDKAQVQLRPLLAHSPKDWILRLAQAAALWQNGQRGEALQTYAQLQRDLPTNRAVVLDYAHALTEGNHRQVQQATSLLRPLLENADQPEIYTAYARTAEKAGDKVRAGEAYADASYYSGRPFDALDQLHRLLKQPGLDYYARVRIQARITELTPLVMELRKRHIPTADNPDNDDTPDRFKYTAAPATNGFDPL